MSDLKRVSTDVYSEENRMGEMSKPTMKSSSGDVDTAVERWGKLGQTPKMQNDEKQKIN